MSQFHPGPAHLAIKAGLRGLLTAVALAGGLALASPGQATEYFLQSDTMNTSRTAHIYGPGGFDEHVYIAPIQFTAFRGADASGPSADFLGFCVDIFHDISLGALNLHYDDVHDLTTDSHYTTNTPFAGATALTTGQIQQVGRLVNYGTAVFNQAPASADKLDRLAAVQGAIWQVINPGYTVVSGNGALDGYVAAYSGANYLASLTGYGAVRSNIDFITETGKYGLKTAHQSFAFGAVPEPSAWVMMIAGFGMTGALVRRSRRRLVAVRA